MRNETALYNVICFVSWIMWIIYYANLAFHLSYIRDNYYGHKCNVNTPLAKTLIAYIHIRVERPSLIPSTKQTISLFVSPTLVSFVFSSRVFVRLFGILYGSGHVFCSLLGEQHWYIPAERDMSKIKSNWMTSGFYLKNWNLNYSLASTSYTTTRFLQGCEIINVEFSL